MKKQSNGSTLVGRKMNLKPKRPIRRMMSAAMSASLLAAVSLSACGKDGPNSVSRSPGHSNYRTLPDSNLPSLNGTYKPVALSNKVFTKNEKTFAPMDFDHQVLNMKFDAANRAATGKSVVFFHQNYEGRPYFETTTAITSVKLNGSATSTFRVKDPDGLGNSYIAVDKALGAGEYGVLEVEYTLPTDSVTFENQSVGFLTDMTDIGAHFFEEWGPTSFEDDAFSMVMSLEVQNSPYQHQVFANGEVVQNSSSHWTITFPAHFTTSSFFTHLTAKNVIVQKFNVEGMERPIPVTVYGNEADLVQQASDKLPGLFRELEADFGPYAHRGFVAYVHPGSGGMEYVGATITSVRSLGHELFHSWFARGVMPAEGRSGWIDEGLASWRDNGYFRAGSLLQRTPTKLAAFSPFRKSTPRNSYVDGRHLLSEIDLLLAEAGGAKPLIRDFYQRYRYHVVTNEEFKSFLETKTGLSLEAYFDRYTLGQQTTTAIEQEIERITSVSATAVHAQEGTLETEAFEDLHPEPLTAEEIESLR